ncbi:MAG: tyrosinase family protein [Aquincola sp.]|nr:tyrosinase family protein [Aquincola sp.]
MGGCEKLAESIRNRPVRRRLRTGSAAVDADIDTYRAAVEAMKDLPGGDPTSWTAQAAIHGLPGGFTFCEHGTDHFFDWHRAYLFYFEKICQKVTNNPQFGLPYWNWNQNPAIHSAFLDNTSVLFLSRTRTSMGSNSAVSSDTLSPMLDNTDFFTYRQQVKVRRTTPCTPISAARSVDSPPRSIRCSGCTTAWWTTCGPSGTSSWITTTPMIPAG